MGSAKYDANLIPTLIGVSGADGQTPVEVWLDPTTHEVYVKGTLSLKSGLTIKFASIAASASGSNTIIAAVSAKKIKVLSCMLGASGAVSVKWQSNATDLSGAISVAANGGFVLPASSPGQGHYFETAINEPLNINLSSAVAVNGHISYYEEA